MKPNIGIDKKDLTKITDILQVLLADESILFQKTKFFHWNVKGPFFITYHELFDKQAGDILGTIDEVAERIRSLGEPAHGTYAYFLKASNLKESDDASTKAADMIAELLKDHETIIQFVRKNLEKVGKHGDEGTVDFMIGIMEEHEKTAWFLRSHLE
jgi:starvation-inducible DNA-binding protein